jgi:predicted MFS family arabinose efflux permease
LVIFLHSGIDLSGEEDPRMTSTYLQKLRLFNRDVYRYLVTVVVLGFAMDGIRAVLLNLYLLRLGYGTEFIGQMVASGAFVFSISCIPSGTLGTRWGCRRIMVAGLILSLVGSVLLPLLVATNILTWVGMALYFVNSVPFLMSVTGPEERNHAFSVQIALTPLAGFAGSLIGGALPGIFTAGLNLPLEDPTSYRYPLLIAALLIIPGVLALLPPREVRSSQTQKPVLEKGRTPWVLFAIIALVVGFRFTGRGAVMTFFNVYLDAGLQVPTVLIGALTSGGLLLAVPAALVTPLVVARWGNVRTIVFGSFGFALSLLPLVLVPHWGAAGFGFMGANAMFFLTTAPFQVFTQELVTPGWRPTMSGAMMTGAGLSLSAIALGGGGYQSLFLAGAGLTAAGGLLFWVYFRGKNKKEKAD